MARASDYQYRFVDLTMRCLDSERKENWNRIQGLGTKAEQTTFELGGQWPTSLQPDHCGKELKWRDEVKVRLLPHPSK